MREVHYSVSYNAQKRRFAVYKNDRKIREFHTEKAAWNYVMERQGAKA
jgi:hypothetical protein